MDFYFTRGGSPKTIDIGSFTCKTELFIHTIDINALIFEGLHRSRENAILEQVGEIIEGYCKDFVLFPVPGSSYVLVISHLNLHEEGVPFHIRRLQTTSQTISLSGGMLQDCAYVHISYTYSNGIYDYFATSGEEPVSSLHSHLNECLARRGRLVCSVATMSYIVSRYEGFKVRQVERTNTGCIAINTAGKLNLEGIDIAQGTLLILVNNLLPAKSMDGSNIYKYINIFPRELFKINTKKRQTYLAGKKLSRGHYLLRDLYISDNGVPVLKYFWETLCYPPSPKNQEECTLEQTLAAFDRARMEKDNTGTKREISRKVLKVENLQTELRHLEKAAGGMETMVKSFIPIPLILFAPNSSNSEYWFSETLESMVKFRNGKYYIERKGEDDE